MHSNLRYRLYKAIFIESWNSTTVRSITDIVLGEQHGPQSLIEAFFVPLFGFGFTESRLIVATLGFISILLMIATGAAALNRWFGLIVALVVGTTPYALYFSRYGDSEHVNVYIHTFLLLYSALLVVRRGLIRDYVLLGLATGLSVYVYATNQLLCAIVLVLVASFQFLPLWRNGIVGAFIRLIAFASVATGISYKMVGHYLAIGRTLLLRTPYGSPNYEFSTLQQLPQHFQRLWNDLFMSGSDPWFARQHGALLDYSLLLLIPGGITILLLVLRSAGDRTRSIRFLSCAAISLALLGYLPAVLSPEPVFRRAILFAIGLDIIKSFGLYGIASLSFNKLPKIVAYILIASLTAGYGVYQWNSFLYDSRSYESNQSNSSVAAIQFIRERAATGKEATVLLPSGPGYLMREDFSFFLKFGLGYPHEIPSTIKIIDLADLAASPFSDVIVPFINYQLITSRTSELPAGVRLENPRIFSNRLGNTFVLVDSVPSPAQSEPTEKISSPVSPEALPQ